MGKTKKSEKEDADSDFEEMEDGYEDSKELDYSETSSSGMYVNLFNKWRLARVHVFSLFHTSTAGLKSQPVLKFLHVISRLIYRVHESCIYDLQGRSP